MRPEQKLRIVEALQSGGEVVAMTGDGINDVPALRVADIGVAMGRRGSDAASEAADMVLTDDDYGTIVRAIERGRTIHENVVRAVHFLLAANLGEVVVFVIAVPLGLGAPLSVLQILLMNLLTDGLPAIALSTDPPERGIMSRPPRPMTEDLLGPVRERLFVAGLATGACGFAAFALGRSSGQAAAQTMAFVTLVAAQLVYVFSTRGTGWPWRAGRNVALTSAVSRVGRRGHRDPRAPGPAARIRHRRALRRAACRGSRSRGRPDGGCGDRQGAPAAQPPRGADIHKAAQRPRGNYGRGLRGDTDGRRAPRP